MKPSAIATQSFFSAYQNQNQKKKVWAPENSQVGSESRALPENKLQNGNIRNDFIHGSYSTHLLFFGHHLLRPNGFKAFYHCLKKCI